MKDEWLIYAVNAMFWPYGLGELIWNAEAGLLAGFISFAMFGIATAVLAIRDAKRMNQIRSEIDWV